MQDELDAAEHLVKNGYLRPAGSLAGVTLERHIKNLLRKHQPPISFKATDSLNRVNTLAKDVVYDTQQWSKVDQLTRIRNLCDHAGAREPHKDEIIELIAGTRRLLSDVPT
jgi:hypothetical protein